MQNRRKATFGKKAAEEERSILLGGRTVTFLFSRKSVRNLNARIRRDGRLFVSAPHTCPYGEVERFLEKNATRLLSALRRAEERKRDDALVFENGATIPLFGAPHRLALCEGERAFACAERGILTVIYPRRGGKEAARAVLSSFLADIAKKEISKICQEIYSEYFKELFPCPAVRFRKMVATYGNCRKDRGVITFNLRLVYAPRTAIAYVVMHELVHMLHPDHSSRFYAALSLRMPDHRERKQLLRDIPLQTDPFL